MCQKAQALRNPCPATFLCPRSNITPPPPPYHNPLDHLDHHPTPLTTYPSTHAANATDAVDRWVRWRSRMTWRP